MPTEQELDVFDDYYWEQKEVIDRRIEEILENTEKFDSRRKLLSHATSGGKRVRPVLTMLAGDVYGTPSEKKLNHAAIVELVHNASLVVDDRFDLDDERRNRPTLWSFVDKLTFTKRGDQFATGLSIMAENTLVALAMDLIDDPDVLQAMSDGLQHLVDGFFMEGRNFTWGLLGGGYDRYIEISRTKTGGLFAMAAWMPVTYLDVPEEQEHAARKWGEQTGILYQVADDIADGDLPSFIESPGEELDKWYQKAIAHVDSMPTHEHKNMMRVAPAYMVERMFEQEGLLEEVDVPFLPESRNTEQA